MQTSKAVAFRISQKYYILLDTFKKNSAVFCPGLVQGCLTYHLLYFADWLRTRLDKKSQEQIFFILSLPLTGSLWIYSDLYQDFCWHGSLRKHVVSEIVLWMSLPQIFAPFNLWSTPGMTQSLAQSLPWSLAPLLTYLNQQPVNRVVHDFLAFAPVAVSTGEMGCFTSKPSNMARSTNLSHS